MLDGRCGTGARPDVVRRTGAGARRPGAASADRGGGFFTDAEPDAMLTEVHRQAQDDPIVRLSMQVREGRRLKPGDYGLTSVVTKDAFDPQRALETDQILVGRNNTRRAYNTRLRERKGFT